MKRIIALLLCVLMLLSVMAGCAKTSESTQTEQPAAQQPAASDKADDTTAAEEPTAEPVKLRLFLYGDSTERRDEYFEHDFHDKILEELNIDFSIEWMPWSEYGAGGSVIANMLASGEAFAFENIMTVNNWHTKGYEAVLSEDDIQTYMPDYLAARGENNGFECCKFNDSIYCIPIGSKAYAGAHQCITVRNELLNEAGWDYTDVHTYEDFIAAMEAVKEIHPEMTIMRGADSLRYALASTLVDGWSCAYRADEFVFVNESEDSDTVYSYYESEQFKQFCYLMQDWVERGWQTQDVITNPGQQEADWYAGNAITMYGTAGNLIETAVKSGCPDADLKTIKIGDQPYIKDKDYDWGISISAADADHVTDWMRLINWIYASQDNYNFCVYGVQGKDWQYAEDGTIEKLVDDAFWDDWFLQSANYVQYDASIPQENIDTYMNWDEGSKVSKLSGFVFDASAVQTEVALLTAVQTEYLDAMILGFLDYDTNYEDVLAKLKNAGIDTYLAEYQRQYSEWRAAQ